MPSGSWLEAELAGVWARAEGSRDRLSRRGQERRRGGLPEEAAPELTGAALLSRSLVGACSSRTAMVPPAGLPKDGNRADQRIRTGSLVVEARLAL